MSPLSKDPSTFPLFAVAVGPQRTGTTWLYEMLRRSEEICLPLHVKETFFFDRYYDRGIDWYAWHFRHCAGRRLVEIAPTYFHCADAIERIRSCSPSCRVIVSLRDPTERAISLFKHHVRKGRVPPDFAEARIARPEIVDAGRYGTHLPRWISMFGSDNVHIVLMEDIASRPAETLVEVCSFLRIDMIDAGSGLHEKVNEGTLPALPWLAHLSAMAVTELRRRRLHRVVEWGKAIGLNAVYRGRPVSSLHVSEGEVAALRKAYEADIRYVENYIGRELTGWRG